MIGPLPITRGRLPITVLLADLIGKVTAMIGYWAITSEAYLSVKAAL
jgi:hypothetical protein